MSDDLLGELEKIKNAHNSVASACVRLQKAIEELADAQGLRFRNEVDERLNPRKPCDPDTVLVSK